MPPNGPLPLDELERLVKAVDPAVVLLPPRLLRRVIKLDHQLTGLGLQVPHRKTYVCGRDRVAEFIEPAEAGFTVAGLPETLLLIAQPDLDALATRPRGTTLLQFWRLLFHAHVHRALEQQAEKLSETALHARVQRLGVAEFEEARAVLRQDNYLLPPGDNRTVYIEFAAVYLELRHFSPDLIPLNFPGLHGRADIDALLAEDLDATALFAATRLEGAPDPQPVAEDAEPSDEEPTPEPATAAEPTDEDLLPRAAAAVAVGNVVRAALLRERAAASRPEQAAALHAAAVADLERLAQRLQTALQLHKAEAESWRQVLPALLSPAAHGIWPLAARLLYDLQKVCTDHERAIYTLDLVEWALSLGQRPIKRPLPGQQEVLALKHLRSALRRLSSARLGDADRRRLAGLLWAAIHHSEECLRDRFRPLLTGVLAEVGLHPANLPERVARHKIVEELLDRIAERGFINLSDLRDALSRNQLKLPDLSGPGEFWHGDPLLLIDQRLGVEMEGVYQRGEIYLRWLQRFSSLAFGTRIGSFLTRYIALPLGGAFFLLKGVEFGVEEAGKIFGTHERHHGQHKFEMPNLYAFVLLALFLFGLMHVPAFRRRVAEALGAAFHGLCVVCALPARLLKLPLVQRVLRSLPVTLAWKYLLKPLLWAGAAAFVIVGPAHVLWPSFLHDPPPWGRGRYALLGMTILFYPLVLFLLHTRLGRELEERFADQIQRTWYQFWRTLLPGLFYAVVDFFRACVEDVDRFLYTVDERLRFHTGDSRLSLYIKPVVGLLWFSVAYLVRFCVNLLIEPQFNPIKHFPVVTVSHKLVLTMGVPVMAQALIAALEMPKKEAYAAATLIGSLIPGIFGFLVWELKENWKLYRANRAPTLRPSVVGSHGETLPRLLRPGFHSGTVPKLFAKLRKARRRAARRGRWRSFRKQRDALHHVEEGVLHFIERELLRLLEESKSWDGLHLQTGEVVLSTNRIRIELHCSELGSEPVWFSFIERNGWLAAQVDEPGWLPRLTAEQRGALTAALAGLYKLGGVDLIGEEEAPDVPCNGTAGTVRFGGVPITWDKWVEVWEQDQEGKTPPDPVPAAFRLLPAVSSEAVTQHA